MSNQPTTEQLDKMEEISFQGYKWDRAKSLSSCGVVMMKGDDMYFFGLTGEIMHNPEGYVIKTN